jgi:predicted exporter
VHGITLAFSFTLIGVAQDYPVHLISHLRPGMPARAVARELWPTLRLGVLATIIAYLTLFSARAGGLAQLSVFTIVGLVAGALVTRFLLPPLMPEPERDVAVGPVFAVMGRRMASLRAGPWLALPILALLAFAVHRQGDRPWWNNNLSELTPIPADWLKEDSRLRAELLPPDVRSFLVLSAPDRETLLRMSETLSPRFDDLRIRGALAHDDLPSRYFPSLQRRLERLSRLPAAVSLRTAVDGAAEDVGYQPSFFEPMIADVAAIQDSIANDGTPQEMGASELDDRLGSILRQEPGVLRAIVALSGLADASEVTKAIESEPGARLVDLKSIAEGLVASLRERVLVGLAVASAAFTALIVVALGVRGSARVLLPVAIGLIGTVATLRIMGIEMTLFHLIALMLSVGLGIDYALFFHRFGAGPDALRALHSVLVSAASTLLAFGLLAASSIPVLRAIGLTVGIGVCAQFTLSLLLARDA